MASRRAAVVFVVVAASCGHRADPPATPAARKDGGVATVADAALEIPVRPLGLPDLAAYQWRKRAGQAAFRTARKAEDRDDWAAVVPAVREAVTADPGHLEAQWLLAIALAKTGHPDEVVAPLQIAVAGDPGKWGLASLDHPALASWLATPAGAAWRARVDQDQQAYAATLARSLVVLAAGDVYAVDPKDLRWYRLTRTYGRVIAAFTAGALAAYVTRSKWGFAVGTVDLATGRWTRPQPLGSSVPPIAIVWSAAKRRFWIGTGATWRDIDPDSGSLHALPPKVARPDGEWLEVFVHHSKLHRRAGDVSADWDDQSLASAVRVGHSSRVIAAPSPGVIDGNTIVWAPDRTHLAFVAQLDDHCTPGQASAAAYVADASTGAVHELDRASGGLAIEWVGSDRVAIAGDHGVSLVSIEGGAAQAIEGADGLVTPRRKPKCMPEPTDEPGAGSGSAEEPDPEN